MKELDSETLVKIRSRFNEGADLPQYESKPQVFRYQKPDLNGRPRAITRLFNSDLMYGHLQYISKGGETTLHSHSGMDGMWMVISGRARFYGDGNELIGEFGPLEGVYIPRDVKYWFESVSEEPTQLLQVEGFVKDRPNKYSNHSNVPREDRSEREKRITWFDARQDT
jgi:mannose-6-phosphate isomerase-like protein (cupin superfamily)